MIGFEQLYGVAEADAACLDNPVDHRAAGVAGAEAMAQILFRRHHERRLAVVVKGTASDEIRSVLGQLDAVRLHQALDGDFSFQPLDLFVRDARL